MVGAFLGLYVTGNTFNIFSLIDMIMLMGLVGKNAILLVDFTDMLRRQGVPRTEAILQAGYTRLRPIIITSSTVLFAMLPLALKLQDGGKSRAPLAVVIMGGVPSSTLLTLVLVPAIYTILDDAKVGVGRLLGRLPRLSFRPKRAPILSWQLSPLAIPAMDGIAPGGFAPERLNGHTNGHVRRDSDGLAGATLEERPSPSGRRTIRVVPQRRPAPAH